MLFTFLAPLLPAARSRNTACMPERLLVLKFGGMGEAVLARSLLSSLTVRHAKMSIDYLVEERTVDAMSSGLPGSIFCYSPAKDGLWRGLALLLKLRRQRYDAVLDFEQRSLLTAVFVWATGAPVRIGFAPAVPSPRVRMFSEVVPLREDASMWNAFVRLGRCLDPGLPDFLSTVPPVYAPAPEADRWLDAAHPKVGHSVLVALHLGVGPSAQYRCWPLPRFVEFAELLKSKGCEPLFILTGSYTEQSLMKQFTESYSAGCINATGIGALPATAALLKRCALMVCGDTGIMHLSAALGTPTIGLFGPNTPACWAPVGPRAVSLFAGKQSCSPCMNSYKRQIPARCTASSFGACMWDITAQSVLSAACSVMREDDLLRLGLQRSSNLSA